MAAVRPRMTDLHPPLRQQAPNEAKCQSPGLRSIRRAEIKPHGLNDFPEAYMIRMTLFGKTLRNIFERHKYRLSIDELDLLDRYGLPRCIDRFDIDRCRATLGSGSITDGSSTIRTFDERPRIAGRGNLFAARR